MDMKPASVRAMRRHAEEAAAFLRVLAHEARLAVLCELISGERTAGELVTASGLSQSALSQHLAKLRDEGLVATRREGQTIHYRLSDPRALTIVSALHGVFCRR